MTSSQNQTRSKYPQRKFERLELKKWIFNFLDRISNNFYRWFLRNKSLTLTSFLTLASFDNCRYMLWLGVFSNSEFKKAEMVISRLVDWKTFELKVNVIYFTHLWFQNIQLWKLNLKVKQFRLFENAIFIFAFIFNKWSTWIAGYDAVSGRLASGHWNSNLLQGIWVESEDLERSRKSLSIVWWRFGFDNESARTRTGGFYIK